MLTKLRIYLADLSLATIERQLQALESDFYQKKLARNRLYSRYTFERQQPKSTYGRDAVVLIGVILMALAGIFLRGF